MMPEQEKTKLIRRTVLQGVIVLLLLTGCVFFGARIAVKAGERRIYRGLLERYPKLMYDRRLARIAEDCAKTCKTQGIGAEDIAILENADFVTEYSVDAVTAMYTQTAKSDAAFISAFLSAMDDSANSDTDICLLQCRYIGIGKYGSQVFVLAYYQE